MTAQDFMAELQVKANPMSPIKIIDASGNPSGHDPIGVTWHEATETEEAYVSIDFDSAS